MPHVYAIQARTEHTLMLVEFEPAEWRAVQAALTERARTLDPDEPAFPSFRRVYADRAHDWVRSGRTHGTGLWIEDGRVRYAASEPGCVPKPGEEAPKGYTVHRSEWTSTGSDKLGVSYFVTAPDGERSPDDYPSERVANLAADGHFHVGTFPPAHALPKR